MTDEPERYLKILDAAGVDLACINCVFFGDARAANDLVARYVAARPDRFVGAAFVTPHYPKEALKELDRCFDKLGMKFLKIYPDYFGRPNDDPAYFPIFEWANERGLAIMGHATFGFDPPHVSIPDRFMALHDRFPNVSWVIAHSGNKTAGQIGSVEAAQRCPKVYLETCTSYGEHGTIERLVNGAGADRVLYGSDMPLMDARLQVGRIATAEISEDAKRKVLGLNAMQLLGLEV
jgi:predicted TIM-barrel fold metal-dependent hydrolase